MGIFSSHPISAKSGSDLWPRAGASQAISGHPASAALGKAPGGFWLAKDAKDPQWLVIDLGHVTKLISVTQTFVAAAAWRFRVEGSNSGATASDTEWVLLAEHDGSRIGRIFIDKVKGNWRYVRLVVSGGGVPNSVSLRLTGSPLRVPPLATAPRPSSHSDLIIMAQSCDLWSARRFWQSLANTPSGWRPLLGEYDEALDEITDAHISQLKEYGIDGFQSCWFREKGNAGRPVMAEYDGLIQSLARSAPRRNQVRWSIFWDNVNPAADGISSASDFTQNVAPFWIAAYLTRPNYLTLDGRPVVGFFSAETFMRQAGGTAPAREALLAFRDLARRAGLPGLVLLANNSGDARADNSLMRELGFDAVMAYATPISTGLLTQTAPDDLAVMQAERQSWSDWGQYSQVEAVLTASVGYDQRPWGEGPVHYLLTPQDWRRITRDAISRARGLPPGSIGRRLLYLDNWNEFGEGHFLEPTVAFGDDYLRGLLP